MCLSIVFYQRTFLDFFLYSAHLDNAGRHKFADAIRDVRVLHLVLASSRVGREVLKSLADDWVRHDALDLRVGHGVLDTLLVVLTGARLRLNLHHGLLLAVDEVLVCRVKLQALVVG